MLDGVMLLWFILTAISVLFVAIDIRSTPESPVLKWGFVLLTAYTGPLGAFLYVLGCREPLPGLHERYVAVRWRQVLGSTMHCVAGDGVGILAGAVIASFFHLSKVTDISLEYLLGFGFGWMIFQALFMRDMAGGSYRRSLTSTFFPELLSMNCLMAGMVPTMVLAKQYVPASNTPNDPAFWFVMSMALLVGFIVAYPMNWWLVSNHMKHGMMTVRVSEQPATTRAYEGKQENHAEHRDTEYSRPMSGPTIHGDVEKVPRSKLVWMTMLSFLVFALGLAVAATFSGV
ncbi:MAG: hypothetical protein B7X12_09005 [Halothiobacillus sp. 20-53-49]|nr:MAG: hypothetical protein B7X12_09005 [Halothiobacillus sp. 20-53-49]HQT65938.1 DUF4396 domain-containing protein [Acidocella sp.]